MTISNNIEHEVMKNEEDEEMKQMLMHNLRKIDSLVQRVSIKSLFLMYYIKLIQIFNYHILVKFVAISNYCRWLEFQKQLFFLILYTVLKCLINIRVVFINLRN